MSNSNKGNSKETNIVSRNGQRKLSKILMVILILTILGAAFQVNIFAQTQTDAAELGTVEPVANIESGVNASVQSISTPYTITYYSNYPAASGIAEITYQDPTQYENNKVGYAVTLAQAGFTAPANYYFVGWDPSRSSSTAHYPEGANLGEIDVNWNLYAVYMPYKTMNWTINDSSYISTYNAQSHTSSINWPIAQSANWAGEVISGLTYQYSVNGGAFSSAKPDLVDAGNYTITVKASAPLYIETTTTVNVLINKAPLTISPDVLSSYKYGGISRIDYSLPAVNQANGPKSQADESALNSVIAATNPLFDAIDNGNVAANLSTALPGSYTVQINSGALAALQSNVAFRNYDLNATGGSFEITALTGLTVNAKALNTIYDAKYHNAVSDITASVTNVKIEYSLDGAAFTSRVPQVKDAGSYTVEIRASAPGYNDATIKLTAVVEKRDATLNILSYNKLVGASDPSFSASFTGLQGSDNIAYTLSRASGEVLGSYTITANVAKDNNYNVKVNNGVLTITILPVTPTNPGTTTDPGTTSPTVPTQPTTTETPEETDETVPETETPEIENEETEVVTADVQSPEEEDTQPTLVNIDDTDLPLSTNDSKGTWALLNLILAIITVVTSFVLIVGYFVIKQKEDEEYEENEEYEKVNRKAFFRFGSAVVALVSVIAFIWTQNMLLDMVFVDRWTILMLVLTIIQVVFSIFARKTKTYKMAEEENI